MTNTARITNLIGMLHSINSLLTDCDDKEMFPNATTLAQTDLKKNLGEAGRNIADLLKSAYSDVHLPTNLYDLNDSEKALARINGKNIEAIKEYRWRTGKGLKESKDAVENWMNANGYPNY